MPINSRQLNRQNPLLTAIDEPNSGVVPSLERFGLVRFHGGDRLHQHRFGFIRWGLARSQKRADGGDLAAGSKSLTRDRIGAGHVAGEFGPRIHFVHLRNVKREPDGSFYEADHLAGDVDMVALVAEIMAEEERRSEQGRSDAEIPMRPDHGHLLGDDGKKRVNPGYSFIGRLKGLAELRGVMQTVEAFREGKVG